MSYVERIHICLNPDGTFRAAAAYNEFGVPVDIEPADIEKIVKGAGAAKEIELLRQERDGLVVEKIELQKRIEVMSLVEVKDTRAEMLALMVEAGAIDAEKAATMVAKR